MIWDWSYAVDILPELLRGLVVTVEAVLVGTILALALGLLWTVCRRSPRRWLSYPTSLWVEFVRSTPLLVQIYFLFYMLPEIGLTLSPLLTGLLALGIHYSAYTSEVYRAGLNTVPRGQWDAARALNFSRYQTYRHVIFPQAIPPVIPALGNYVIAMFKDTPMLSAITVLELLQRAKILGKESFRFLEPLTLVGGMYLVASLLAGVGVAWLERRLAMDKE
ncbi:MAG: ectoine/hydroxyectoine ABC transporter permease subunit EhuD [Proteobacteria bacterium]|nr:ectoine/hydroxyectoine ABC transporter permease subunit EhuD [Pseudomonadota bacterium]